MKSKTIKVSTWLPLFPGFYNTLYEPDETHELESLNEYRIEQGLPILENANWDYQAYEEQVVDRACGYVKNKLLELDMVKHMFMEKIVHPREYNFANDSVNIIVDACTEQIMEYLKTHVEEFQDYLKRHYTSYDGFMSNNVSDWMEDGCLEHQHMLGSILQFILQNEDSGDNNSMDMYYACTEDLYLQQKEIAI